MDDLEFWNAVTYHKIEKVKNILENLEQNECFITYLARAYELLMMKNITANEEIVYLISSKLVDHRFFSSTDNTVTQSGNLSLSNAITRIQIINGQASYLVNNCYQNKYDSIFSYRVQIICQHLEVLKKYLKTTYYKLPWIEMQFCLLILLIAVRTESEINSTYKLVLDGRRVVKYLGIFAETLSEISSTLGDADINHKIRLPQRDTIIKSVVENNPGFEGLYTDYEIVRDLYSLTKITYYIQKSSTPSHADNAKHEKLMIQRTLQVIGENLKNSAESPNISRYVHQLLMNSAPAGFKVITTSLRDILSHAHSLLERLHIEDNKDEMFLVLKSELKLIQSDMYVVLNARKIDAVFAFLNKIQLTGNIDDLRYLLAHFTLQKTESYRLFGNDLVERVVERIEEMFGKIRGGIDTTSQFEIKLFEKISELFMSERVKIKESHKELFFLLKSLSNTIYNVRHSDHFTYLKETFNVFAKSVNFRKKEPCNFYKRIGLLLVCMYNSLKSKESMERLADINNLMQILHVHTLTMRTVEDLKIDLDQYNSSETETKQQIDNLIKIILFLPISNLLKTKISDGYAKKKHIAEVKSILKTMIKDLRQNESSSSNKDCMMEWERLVKQLETKKYTEESLVYSYKSRNIVRCENLLNIIDDSYTTLCKCAKGNSVFINNSKQNAIKNFLGSLKLKKRDTENVMEAFTKYQKDKIKICYKERLDMLKTMLTGNKIITRFIRDSRIQFVVEALLLDLLEILENLSFFSDNRLLVDNFSPVIIGKALRNYLAHGNLFLDTLPLKPSWSILCTAFKLIHIGDGLLDRKDIVIGKIDILDEGFIISRHLEILYQVTLQTDLLFYTSQNDVASMKKCIEKGSTIFGRSVHGIGVLQYAAMANSLESFEFALKEVFKTDYEEDYKNDLLHIALKLAAQYGSDRIITYFIENNLDLTCSFDGTTLVHFAAQYGHMRVLEQLISTYSFDVRVYNDHNLTPLHVASGENRIEIVKLLLMHGCHVSDECLCLKTALHYAAKNGHTTVLEVLLNHKTSVGCINAGTSTSLHLSAENGHLDVVSLLLQHGADPFLTDKDGLTPLELCVSRGHATVVEILFRVMFTDNCKVTKQIEHKNVTKNIISNISVVTCYNGYISILQFLIKMGVEVDKIQGQNGGDLIHIAIQAGHECITNELIAAGVDINLKNRNGHTPLHFSSENGHSGIVDALISAGANMNIVDENGLTPLCLASLRGHIVIVKNLVKRGADVNLAGPKMMTPLHAGVYSENLELVEYLLKNNAHVDSKTEKGIAPLHLAVRNGLKDVVNMLIEHGAPIDVQDIEHYTPLHLACCHGHTAIVRILLENDAQMDITTIQADLFTESNIMYKPLNAADGWCFRGGMMPISGVTPMHLAALQGHSDIVSLLLENGALFDIAAEKDLTPFNLACQEGHMEIAEMLMNSGANMYHNAGERHHCITCAVRKNHTKAVMILLKLGAQVNEADSRGYSLLHIAAFAGYTQMIHVLLANGATIDKSAANGETPLHMALKNGKMEIVLALRRAGANPDISGTTGESPSDFAVAPNKPNLSTILCDADDEKYRQN